MRDETDPDDQDELQEAINDAEQIHKQNTLIYDEKERKIDLSKLLVTDAKYNTRSYPPRRVEPEHEIKIQLRKQQLLEVFEDQKTEICNIGNLF